ncbi:MAG: RimK/LysX family protein [Hyphomicrobiaceae bacterium]|nr:RimK/LysX family protein [Hyphomicrobiaceae bacterium]
MAGWAETIRIVVGDTVIAVPAKLDTGAQTSSLAAVDVTTEATASGVVVRFKVPTDDDLPGARAATTAANSDRQTPERSTEIAAPLVRWARVRRAGVGEDRRPVVRVTLCVAGLTADAEVTLTDRSGMTCPALVGRSFLAGRILVDAARRDLAAD